jgi:hypothetical protein
MVLAFPKQFKACTPYLCWRLRGQALCSWGPESNAEALRSDAWHSSSDGYPILFIVYIG